MPRSIRSPSFSFSSSSSSSSLSTTTTTSLSHARNTRTSTQKLKHWFSSHLHSPAPQDAAPHHHTGNNNGYTTPTYKSSNPETDTDLSHPSSSSARRVPPDLIAATVPDLNSLNYDYNYNYNDDHDHESASPHRIFTNSHRPTYQAERDLQRRHRRQLQRRQQQQSEREDLALSDNYAAYCRAFTSSPPPSLDPNQAPSPRKPLPYLPPSEPWATEADGDGGAGAEAKARAETQTHVPHPEMNLFPPPGSGSAPASPPAPAPGYGYNHGRAQSSSQIRFLPIGAHGYHPANWALPSPPSPPPGILTPDRYEEIQRQQVQENNEKQEKVKERSDKQTRGWLTWCMPIRFALWPWGRAKRA
ncbi:hypothetical protein BJX70DRAFT_16909 [Aspergillus crustosus]